MAVFTVTGDTAPEIGGAATDDRYVLDAFNVEPNQELTITDTLGANVIQLTGGLEIASSSVTSNAMQLTLDNGAVITILGADTFTFQTGGNGVNGTGGLTESFDDFVTNSLGLPEVPAEGDAPESGDPVTVDEDGGTNAGTTDPDATFALAADAADVDEGETATFTLTTENVAEGTEVAYTITGVDAADVTGPLTGTATVAADGTATISVDVAADELTEGEETLTVALDNGEATADVTVNDTSLTPVFELTASSAEVDESGTATFEVINGEANTVYAYEVTGTGAAADVATFTTDADGNATFTVDASDDVAAGGETITVSIIGESLSASVDVNPVNDAPVLTDPAATLADGTEDTAYTVSEANLLEGFTDEEGDALSVVNLAADSGATVADNGDGTYTITPVADFNGAVALSYDVTDGELSTAATQTVNFEAVNDEPTTTDAATTATEAGAAVTGQLDAEDVDGDDLTFALDAPVDGLTLNPDGSYSFDPAANPAVQALTYTDADLDEVANYTVSDGNGGTVQGTLTVTVAPTPLSFELTPAAETVDEGSTQTYTVTASEAVATNTDVIFKLDPGDGTAVDVGTSDTNTNDFAQGAFNPETVTMAAGTTEATFDVSPLNDQGTELPEEFTVSATIDGTLVGTVIGTVQDSTDPVLTGQTFTLTENADSGADFVGTTGNDTYEAAPVLDGGSLVDTLQSIDVLDGDDGTDTLEVTLDTGIVAAPTLTSIENIDLRSTTTASFLDLSGATGVENVTVANSTDSASVQALGAVGSIDVADQTDNVFFSGSTAATLDLGASNFGNAVTSTVNIGAAAATTLNLNLADNDLFRIFQAASGSATTINATVSGDNTVDFAGVDDTATTLNVDGAGSLTADGTTSSFAALTDLNVTGDASVDLSAVTIGTLETVAAGGTTGDVALSVDETAEAVTTGSGSDEIMYVGTAATNVLAATAAIDLGAGDDMASFGINYLDTAGAVVDGGDGTADTLGIQSNADSGATIQGFEILAVTDALANNLAVGNFGSIQDVELRAGVGASSTIFNLESGATIENQADSTGNTLTVDGALLGAADDALNLLLNEATAGAQDFGTVDVSDVETLNIDSGTNLADPTTTDNLIAVTDGGNVETVVVTGDVALSLTGSGGGDLAGVTTLTGHDAGLTADISNAFTSVDQTVTLGAGDDTVTLGDGTNSVTAGAGNDVIVGGINVDTIDGGADDDVITGNGGGDVLTGGAGADTFVYLAASDSSGVNVDTITDFMSGEDLIDLSGITPGGTGVYRGEANGITAANTALTGTVLTPAPKEAILDTSNNQLYVDVDGNGVIDSNDLVIELTGVTDLAGTDFIF